MALCPALAFSATYTVNTVAELKTRLENANNGDIIKIDGNGGSGGVYTYTGNTYSIYTTDGWTNLAPMFLINNVSNVTIQALDASKKPILQGKSRDDKYVFYGQKVSGITIKNIKFTKARKGVVIDRSDNITFEGNEIYEIGEEGFHLRDGSDNAVIKNNVIRDTGLVKVDRGEAIYICNDRKMWNPYYQPNPVEENYQQNCDNAHIYGNTIGPNVGNNGVDVKEGTVGVYIENNVFKLAWTRSELTGSNSGDHPNVAVHFKGSEGVATGNTFDFNNAPASLYRAISVDRQLDDDPGLTLVHGYDNWAVNNTIKNAGSGVYAFHALSDGGATFGCNSGANDKAPSPKPDRVYVSVSGSGCTPPNAPTAGGPPPSSSSSSSSSSGSTSSSSSSGGSTSSSGGSSSSPAIGNNNLKFVNKATNECLQGGSSNSSTVLMRPCDGGSDQSIDISNVSGYARIDFDNADQSLDAGPKSNGDAVRTYRQSTHNNRRLQFISVGSYFQIKSVTNGLCVEATASDTDWRTCNTSDNNQLWSNSGSSSGGSTSCITYNSTSLKELTLNSARCVKVTGGLGGKEISIADSDVNPSCDIRGTAKSQDGNGTRVIDGNWEKISGGWTGTTIQFDVSNSCQFLKLRVRPL